MAKRHTKPIPTENDFINALRVQIGLLPYPQSKKPKENTPEIYCDFGYDEDGNR